MPIRFQTAETWIILLPLTEYLGNSSGIECDDIVIWPANMFIFVALLRFSESTFRPDHAISLGVVAPWFGVPLFDQILCFLADMSREATKQFLRATLLSFDHINNESFLWSTAEFLYPSSTPLLHAFVDVGFYLPRIEMFREAARSMSGSDYSPFIVVSSGSKPDLPLPFDFEFHSHNSTLFDFDLSFGNSTLYIYANLQNETAVRGVQSLMEAGTRFVLRPISRTSQFGIPLRGFGIEMRPFKYSMEYGVKDSAVLMGEKRNISVTDPTVASVNGIPRNYVDVTAIDRFGPRLTAWIMNRTNQTLPSILKDLTANFPLFLPEIADTNWTIPSFKVWQNAYRMAAPSLTSLLNGNPFDLSRLDLFTLLDSIAREQSYLKFLRANELSPTKVRELQESTPKSKTFLLDYESDLIVYLNDIENDPEYRLWSTDLNAIFTRGVARQSGIRKNLVTVVAYVDPILRASATVIVQLHYLVAQGSPVRVGLIPFFSLGNRLSRKVAFAFHYIARQSHRAAIEFLIRALTIGAAGEDRSLKIVSEVDYAAAFNEFCQGTFSWSRLHELFDTSSPEFASIEATNALLKRTGISANSMAINGRFFALDGERGIPSEPIQEAINEVMQLIAAKRIRTLEEVNVKALLATRYTTLPTVNSRILSPRGEVLQFATKPLTKMTTVAAQLEDIEWTGAARAQLTYILYSNNTEHIAAFERFSLQSHGTPSEFAANPPQRLLPAGEDGLIVNGRIFRDVDLADPVVLPLIELVANSSLPRLSQYSSAQARLLAFLITEFQRAAQDREPTNPNPAWPESSPLIYNSQNGAEISWDIFADPFTRDFQRIAAMIDYVDSHGLARVRLIVVPPMAFTEVPVTLTAYYRNAFDEDRAVFTMLNDTTTYSSMPDAPTTWVFESMHAVVDLDNILLSELAPSEHLGTYVLTNIAVEGTAWASDGHYAEGAELAILDGREKKVSDTIVMRLNGYWQLAANPGIWQIDLGGYRSRTIYEIPNTVISVHTFARRITVIVVNVRPGMEGMRVYNVTSTDTSNTTRVDVFSVASGHLYERLLKIMMLAVRRQSQYNVKFWIIKAFLSPQFKATLPVMSKQYNFTYQLVSYKWPVWLKAQYEKQRIIWGNKILFLDVIFPLDLDRVIYIDSDQIVRADLIELMRMDFGVAPYAFTPFCDSRLDTEPFRFWKRGFWENHLKGLKYHISALFAINLHRFRKLAAGDWIRYYYHLLSGDPNSLANLDQDLPNYIQHQIPIYSLPQNWLWCETWCSMETLKDAKTIDLCNNPLTKKPKLYVAQTFITEWPGLDEEVKNISAGPDEYQKFFFQNDTNPQTYEDS
jgi:UDP-glucose:glycoprotein glucosyltransferase